MTHIKVDVLFDRLFQDFNEFPQGVISVPNNYEDRIKGTAFFPGGDGLFEPKGKREIPKFGIMVLGNNFGCWPDFQLSQSNGAENIGSDTWDPLITLLSPNKILDSCFFTNVYIGFLDSSTNMSKMPRPKIFKQRCLQFLQFQITMVQPKWIIALGDQAIRAIGMISELDCGWKSSSIAMLDRSDLNRVPFQISHQSSSSVGTAIALYHSSYWGTRRSGTNRTQFEYSLVHNEIQSML